MLTKKLFTLVFIRHNRQLLLGFKKRGFGVNKWNGFGGKVEPNETIIEAASREVNEECCVRVKTTDLKNVGHIEFTFEGDPVMMDVRVFTTTVFEGSPTETEEMLPKWFDFDKIPFQDMWPDDKLWFPYMLKDKPIFGRFHFNGFVTIVRYKIEELESMETFYNKRNVNAPYQF